MTRLPFDPDRLSTPLAPDLGSQQGNDGAMTVSQVALLINQAVADAAPRKIRVVGEVSNFVGRDHWFFSIKDDQATLRCVCFASIARQVKAPVQDGLTVVITGRLAFYEVQGHIQFYVDKVEPVGQGPLELQLRVLCDQLAKLGYFDEEKKLSLPAFPQCVAVVTSRSGAALQDVIDTTSRRWPGLELLLYDVRVQGDQAAGQIGDAITTISQQAAKIGIDAVILTRGGGSIEDLWAFNERVVADAIYHCKVPIVAAIGHQTDTTVAELVADLRSATPTQAAMALVPDAAALMMQVHQYAQRLTGLLSRQSSYAQQRLDAVRRHSLFRRPDLLVNTADQRLSDLVTQLVRSEKRCVEERNRMVAALDRQLSGVGPQSILGRGYSYTLDSGNRPLKLAKDVQKGHRITTVLCDGRISSIVESSGKETLPVGRPKQSDRGQGDLF